MATAKKIALAIALALALPSLAQSLSFAQVCESVDIPTRAEYESNPGDYADNFCALATYAPHRAARQFDSMIKLVRAHNNPNRFYWDPRIEPATEHIQLLRPWMAEQDWWLQWPTFALPISRQGSSYFGVRYFEADQRRKAQPTPTFILELGRSGQYGRGGTEDKRYWAVLRGHFDDVPPDGKVAYLLAESGGFWGGDLNEYRITLVHERPNSYYAPAGVLTAALHEALDCLADPAMLEDWNFEGCEVTIEADRRWQDE